MPKLVQNLRKEERYTQEHQVARSEELLKLRQFCAEMVEFNSDEQQRGEHQRETAAQDERMKHPSHVGERHIEESVRVDAFKANSKNIGAGAEYLLSASLLTSFEELVTLIWNARDDQTALMKLSDKALDLFERDLLRRIEPPVKTTPD